MSPPPKQALPSNLFSFFYPKKDFSKEPSLYLSLSLPGSIAVWYGETQKTRENEWWAAIGDLAKTVCLVYFLSDRERGGSGWRTALISMVYAGEKILRASWVGFTGRVFFAFSTLR